MMSKPDETPLPLISVLCRMYVCVVAGYQTLYQSGQKFEFSLLLQNSEIYAGLCSYTVYASVYVL